MTKLRTALATAAKNIAVLPQASPRLEAELLLCQVLARPRSYLATWPERSLTLAQEAELAALTQRRLDGEPIAYILGQREFWTLTLRVTPEVLIPRPETELLVELALMIATNRQQAEGLSQLTVVDIGTGSGAIAAALAQEHPNWSIYATDLSAAALAVAEDNFQRLGLPVQTHLGSWYAALPPGLRFDLIISNPPYIADTDPHLQHGDLPKEPRLALVAGPDGLEALRPLCDGAAERLRPGGSIFLEHGYNQGQAVRTLLQQAGFTSARTWCDLAGHERVTAGSVNAVIGFSL